MKFSKIFLCLTILISSVNCAYAAEDGGVSEALRQVKERVDTSEYTDFKSDYYKNEDGKATHRQSGGIFCQGRRYDIYRRFHDGAMYGAASCQQEGSYGRDQ